MKVRGNYSFGKCRNERNFTDALRSSRYALAWLPNSDNEVTLHQIPIKRKNPLSLRPHVDI
jgi:hypothetical protein